MAGLGIGDISCVVQAPLFSSHTVTSPMPARVVDSIKQRTFYVEKLHRLEKDEIKANSDTFYQELGAKCGCVQWHTVSANDAVLHESGQSRRAQRLLNPFEECKTRL